MRGDVPVRSQLVAPVLAHVRAAGGDADGLARAFGPRSPPSPARSG